MSSFIFLRGKETEINRWRSVVMHFSWPKPTNPGAGPGLDQSLGIQLRSPSQVGRDSAIPATCQHLHWKQNAGIAMWHPCVLTRQVKHQLLHKRLKNLVWDQCYVCMKDLVTLFQRIPDTLATKYRLGTLEMISLIRGVYKRGGGKV